MLTTDYNFNVAIDNALNEMNTSFPSSSFKSFNADRDMSAYISTPLTVILTRTVSSFNFNSVTVPSKTFRTLEF